MEPAPGVPCRRTEDSGPVARDAPVKGGGRLRLATRPTSGETEQEADDGDLHETSESAGSINCVGHDSEPDEDENKSEQNVARRALAIQSGSCSSLIAWGASRLTPLRCAPSPRLRHPARSYIDLPLEPRPSAALQFYPHELIGGVMVAKRLGAAAAGHLTPPRTSVPIAAPPPRLPIQVPLVAGLGDPDRRNSVPVFGRRRRTDGATDPEIAACTESPGEVLEPRAESPERDAKQEDDESRADERHDVVIVSDAGNNEIHDHHADPCDQKRRQCGAESPDTDTQEDCEDKQEQRQDRRNHWSSIALSPVRRRKAPQPPGTCAPELVISSAPACRRPTRRRSAYRRIGCLSYRAALQAQLLPRYGRPRPEISRAAVSIAPRSRVPVSMNQSM